jgi:uncharacterized protein (TIGR03546 family)
MSFLLQPVRYLARALTEECSSRQLALGFAMGLVIGLVPKGNLTAVALMTILCASRVNLAAGMLSAFLFSWIAVLTDPLTHFLGWSLLRAEFLTPLWTSLYDVPLVPWTAFNNTVVLGSLVLGLVLLYPAYRLSEPLFARYTPLVQAKLSKLKVAQLLLGAEWAGRFGRV